MTDLLTASKKALSTLEHHQADISYILPLQVLTDLKEAIQEEEERRAGIGALQDDITTILFDPSRIKSLNKAGEIADEIVAVIDATQATPDETPTVYLAEKYRTSAMYFMTVEWCSDGYRGIFCSYDGTPFRKDGEPHTQEEMDEVLGPFWLILGAKSEPFTEEEIAEYTYFHPLAEYKNQYGIALKRSEFEEKYHLPNDEATSHPDGEKPAPHDPRTVHPLDTTTEKELQDMLESTEFERGDQVAYLPPHAQDINDPGVEFGFVTSVHDEHAFVRYWYPGPPPGRLRTTANSERTPMRRLVHFDLIHQPIVDELLSSFAQEEKRVSTKDQNN